MEAMRLAGKLVSKVAAGRRRERAIASGLAKVDIERNETRRDSQPDRPTAAVVISRDSVAALG